MTTTKTAIEGTHYLMISSDRFPEHVARYNAAEMIEVYTPAQRATLAAGETLKIEGRFGTSNVRDMVAATRALA